MQIGTLSLLNEPPESAGKDQPWKAVTIYLIKTGQPCTEHGQLEGEAINPQEHVTLKLKILD